jgi:hypothetical protein
MRCLDKLATRHERTFLHRSSFLTTRDLVAWREVLVTPRNRVRQLFDEGPSEQQVVAERPLADLDKKWIANGQQAHNWLRMVYNSFKRS